MNKLLGSTCLVAGTAIGAGMLALPMVLAKLGILMGLVAMLVVWAIMYYTALLSLELNLQAGKGTTLGDLGKKYSGPIAKSIGHFSFKLLSFSLIAAYVHGGSSIIQNLLLSYGGQEYNFKIIAVCYTLLIFIILLPTKQVIKNINLILFLKMVLLLLVVIVAMLWVADTSAIPNFVSKETELGSWSLVIPVLFTSFGFQVIFHTLTDYCNRDKILLKKAFFWGSIIPMIFYLLWTSATLGLLYTYNKPFLSEIINGSVSAGQLIETLVETTNWKYFQLVSWVISILAILTSTIGVSLGLVDSWSHLLMKKKIDNKILSIALALIIPMLVGIYNPNAFISALGFAGMILTIIAIFLPIYLLYKGEKSFKKFNYNILTNKPLRVMVTCFAIVVVLLEIYSITS